MLPQYRPPTHLIGALVTVLLCSTVTRTYCQEIKCYHPAVPPNTRVTLSSSGITPGTTATYRCDEGYETFGNTTLVCSPTGEWQGEIPFCGGPPPTLSSEGDQSYHKGCCGQQPLQDLEIRIGNNSHQLQKNPLCAWFPGTLEEGVTKTFTCARTLIGQYVFVQLGVEGTLSLCEVEVFSSDELPVHTCQSSKNLENAALATFEKKCYFFEVNKGSTFKTARSTCQSINSDLIHNLSTLDMSFLRAQLDRWKPKLKTQLVWLGANKDPGVIARTWKWVNGEIVQKPTWGRDQPNNYNGEQNCVVLDGGRDWLWNDVGCSLDYLHWICQYGPLNCGSPDKNVNTTIKGADYNVGSKIEYSCPPGNVLIGDKVRSCEKNAVWTGSAPTCRYVDCGPPPKLENGTVSLVNESTTYGAKLLYTCNENYTLVGEEIQVCKKDGKWSGTVPKCLFSICQEPPSVHGGMINVSGYKVGDTATYNCLTGYVMFGMEKLRCGLGGEWVGKPPFCKYVDCGFPTDIEYGKYDLKNGTTIVGSIVEYTCIDDYWLDGERLQRCTREGKWTADAPVCQLITCDEPEVPPGSYVIGYDFNVHSKIEYHCETGHLLIGKSSHVCEKTGEWSDSVPVCEFIDCGKVPPLNNGNVEYINGTTYLKSEVRYSCNKNFKLIGTPKRICQENKQWSDDTPKCEEIRCPEPVIPEHGVISVTGNDRLYGRTLIKTAESSHTGATSYKVGASLKYRCGRGYKVVGEALSTCENTGSWSGDVPQCIYVDCGEPKKLQHGQVVLPTNATFYGVLALYSCFENYELEGVSRRLCQENGTWSSDAPKCREIQCKEPKANKGVLYKVETRSIGGTVKYSCPKGYLIQGNSTRTCLKNGSWSGIAPECKPRNCSYPKDIENGRIIVINGTTYNSAIEYHCIPNFVREGPYLRKCMENGEWSGDEPACKVAANETRDTSQIGTGIGIGAGVLVFLLVLLGAIYFKLRKPVAVKNTENVEEAERKEDKSAAVMSYATLSDRNGHANLYENIREENLYDAPYEERRRRDSGVYEPEPGGGDNFITINGITVR